MDLSISGKQGIVCGDSQGLICQRVRGRVCPVEWRMCLGKDARQELLLIMYCRGFIATGRAEYFTGQWS